MNIASRAALIQLMAAVIRPWSNARRRPLAEVAAAGPRQTPVPPPAQHGPLPPPNYLAIPWLINLSNHTRGASVVPMLRTGRALTGHAEIKFERCGPEFDLRGRTSLGRNSCAVDVADGSNPDFLLRCRASASAECRHWSARGSPLVKLRNSA